MEQSTNTALMEQVGRTAPKVTRGGCPLHPGARTVATPKRTICFACERERREADRLRREAGTWRDWREADYTRDLHDKPDF